MLQEKRGRSFYTTAISTAMHLRGSIWLFPLILLLPLIILTSLEINGSSVGVIHNIFYGDFEDQNLIANRPRAIRSDEWLLSTQKTLSQVEKSFPRVNTSMGNGEDISLIDAPYKEWSVLFKPQNIAFFILPLNKAFAFKWWFMGYLLIVSCYMFTVTLLPKQKLLGTLLGVSLFFSGFVQWWYLYGTLASLYYPLFIATLCVLIFRERENLKKIFLGILLAYFIAAFLLVLYPPFQLATGLVVGSFLIGFFATKVNSSRKHQFRKNIAVIFSASLVALSFFGLFIYTRIDVVKAVTNTVYPGNRSFDSGKFDVYHFMSSHLGHNFTSDEKAANYLINGKDRTNQSEASNFLLVLPFLLLPALFLLLREYKLRGSIDWLLLMPIVAFIVLLLRLFAPWFTPLSKLMLLNNVGDARILIGLGLLNIICFVVFIRNMLNNKYVFPFNFSFIYLLIIFVIELIVSFYVRDVSSGFISTKEAILFSIPLPVIVYFLMQRRFIIATILFTSFTVFVSYKVNPLYRGLDVITNDPLSIAIKEVGLNSEKRWIAQGGYLENAAIMNGKPSLSGIYLYPQLSLWQTISGATSEVYNRYAHVGFQLSDNSEQSTVLKLHSEDSFTVVLSPCSSYLKEFNVGFAVTTAVLTNPCVKKERIISYPFNTVYIYSLNL